MSFPTRPKKPAETPARLACTVTLAGAPPGFLAKRSRPSSVSPTGVKSIKSSPMDKSCAIFQTAFRKIKLL